MGTLIRISVRRLVEFIFNSGDIDRTVGAVRDAEAMQEGSRIHRKLQKRAGADYHAEVPMKLCVDLGDDLSVEIEGRADGVIETYHMPDILELLQAADGESAKTVGLSKTVETAKIVELSKTVETARSVEIEKSVESEKSAEETAGPVKTYTIDEIKSTYTSLRQMKQPLTVHLAQAYCYAYIYALQHHLETIDVQMTYVHIGTEQIVRFKETKTFSELNAWFDDMMARYEKWIRWQLEWQRTRNASAQAIHFPFEYRPGQQRLVGGIYRTITQKKKLFALAPTGTGKTISAIFPALKVMGEGKSGKIFYLTAKTITRTVAEDTYAMLAEHGLAFKSLTLTARDKICIFDEAKCYPKQCERACGHYDRVNDAVFDMITHECAMTREVVERYAEKHCVCPFEMQLDAALWVDGLICDYNYVFDPGVYLRRFFGESYDSGPKTDDIFLVDEAHNLVERSREMYSAELSIAQLKNTAALVKPYAEKLAQKINKCVKYMAQYESECGSFGKIESVSGLSMYLMRMCTDMEKFLKGRAPLSVREKVLECYLEARTFNQTCERMDERYMIYGKQRDEGGFMVKIFCIDPSKDLGCRMNRALSTIMYSATLLPVTYYKNMLSTTPKDDYDLYTPSPFDQKNRLLIAAGDVSSKYTRRTKSEYEKIASYIQKIVRAQNGNYMVFFPSYAFMASVLEAFGGQALSKAGSGIELVIQENAMTEEARQAFLARFDEETKSTVIGFCVLGGIFSEGIDLKAKRLIGVIVVGTGLPQIGDERELLRSYYDAKDGCGYEYAYVYPGINKVLQAGGRVIRTETDTGVIALLDERFHTPMYKSLFPEEWFDCARVTLQNVEDSVNRFWEEKMEESE